MTSQAHRALGLPFLMSHLANDDHTIPVLGSEKAKLILDTTSDGLRETHDVTLHQLRWGEDMTATASRGHQTLSELKLVFTATLLGTGHGIVGLLENLVIEIPLKKHVTNMRPRRIHSHPSHHRARRHLVLVRFPRISRELVGEHANGNGL